MNDYQLGLYEKALPGELSFPQKLELARSCGFDWLEISIDETDEKQKRLWWTEEEIQKLRGEIGQTGVPILTMCLSGHRKYPFGPHDAKVREHSLDIMQRAVNLAGELGIRIIQLAGYDVYYETSDEDTVRWFRENLQKAALMAARGGVCLGFETMETPFLDTVEKGMRYVRQVDSPYLGMYPDIGNLKNAACLYGNSVPDDLRLGRGHTFAAHLKETKPGVYRNMRFGTGHTEYEPCIAELLRQGVRMFTGEFWYQKEPDWQQNVCAASSFLREKIEAASELNIG